VIGEYTFKFKDISMDELKSFTFSVGSNLTREDGMCLMEAVSYLAGEEHTDTPKCASPIITNIAIYLNDVGVFDDRQAALADLPWRIVGTANPEFELAREAMYVEFMETIVDKLAKEPIPTNTLDFGMLNFFWTAPTLKKGGRFLRWNCQRKQFSALYLDLLDRMIKLTEIKEVVPVSRKSFLQTAAAGV
jgi:hypothetical protein